MTVRKTSFYLSTNLVTALTGLDMNDFTHFGLSKKDELKLKCEDTHANVRLSEMSGQEWAGCRGHGEPL